jgi:hypothetical protein
MALDITRSPTGLQDKGSCHHRRGMPQLIPHHKSYPCPLSMGKEYIHSSATHQPNVENSDAHIVDFYPLDTSCLIYSPGITRACGGQAMNLHECYTTHDYASLTRTKLTFYSSRVAACDTLPNRARLWLLGIPYRDAVCGAAEIEAGRRAASRSRRRPRARMTASGRRGCAPLTAGAEE